MLSNEFSGLVESVRAQLAMAHGTDINREEARLEYLKQQLEHFQKSKIGFIQFVTDYFDNLLSVTQHDIDQQQELITNMGAT